MAEEQYIRLTALSQIFRWNYNNLFNKPAIWSCVPDGFIIFKSWVFHSDSGAELITNLISAYFFSLQELSDVRILEKWRVINHPLQIPVKWENTRKISDLHDRIHYPPNTKNTVFASELSKFYFKT